MKTIKYLIYILVTLSVIGTSVYTYYGGFTAPEFIIQPDGGYLLVYQQLSGDYKFSGQAIQRTHDALSKQCNVESINGFGTYYDNPAFVEKNKLRFDAGCIVDMKDSAKLASLEADYKIKTLPKAMYVSTEFPYKGSLSIMLGVMKVYPAFNQYVKQHALQSEGPITEIYMMDEEKIRYLQELKK